MRIGSRSVFIAGLILCAAVNLTPIFAQSVKAPASAQAGPAVAWILPHDLTVKDNGPRTYRMIADYNIANSIGAIVQRRRIAGEYTRGLAGGEVSWKNVTAAEAQGATGLFDASEKRDFMEGFHYRDDLALTMKPDFFKGFPPTAVFERNLVWDTGMVEYFGQSSFEHLKLNEPYHLINNQTAIMPDVGTFQNRDVVLEWVGRSRRNGQDCALIEYQAFFNPVEIATGGMTLKGRSDYWGEIWVSLATKQIEYGTIYESVVGEMKLAGQDNTQVMNIFRQAVLEPIKTN